MRVFITGIGRGIGKKLVELYLEEGAKVYGVGRKNPFNSEIQFIQADLTAVEQLPGKLRKWEGIQFQLAILNAGVLGEIKDLKEWSLWELNSIFQVNLWANKVLIDWLSPRTGKIVAISSGAAVNGNRGWGGYALSKAGLNMLVKLYSHEIPGKIYAIAPGVIGTQMVQQVLEGDREKFPSIQRVKAGMLPLEEGVRRLKKGIEVLDRFPSGSFVDVRELELER
ncbi:MAG: SDR family NAD(P)-dependent oxidoreductase [Campylobacterales bacterium]